MTAPIVDLFTLARSGIRASRNLLETTGNNIANVNTEGYVRQRTEFGSVVYGGVGRGETERIFNQFAYNQLRRDTSNVAEFETYEQRTGLIDNLFASEANSLSASLSRVFGALQTASTDPTNVATRQLVLGEAQSFVGQASTISDYLQAKQEELNLELETVVDRANSLIQNIAKLNEDIQVFSSNGTTANANALLNERDQAILELSEIMEIDTRPSGVNGDVTLVNVKSGEALVLQDGTFNLFELNGDPDIEFKTLGLQSTDQPSTLILQEESMGGIIGGLFRYRDEVLEPARRDLGQIALVTAAALNEQNRLGMDLDRQLGSDIFSTPEFSALNYRDNPSGLNTEMNARISREGANQLTSADYLVEVDAVNAGVPPSLDVTVTLLDSNGSPVLDATGSPVAQSYTGLAAQSGTFNEVLGGLEIEFPDGAGYNAGDRFLFQPTRRLTDDLEVQITRPEDLAFALPIIVEPAASNLSEVNVVDTKVTNTFVDNTAPFDPDTSAFDGAGGIHGPGAAPGGGVGAPASIIFTSPTDYEVRDSGNNLIVSVTGVTDYNDLLSKAAAEPGWPAAFAALNDYPGYDFSLQGQPANGDVFNISYNAQGLNDNRNAVEMAEIQNEDIIISTDSDVNTRTTLAEKYGNLVGFVGEKAAMADISLASAEALKTQSEEWFESVSGVNLDEEAANLVRYQQTYAAAARVLTAAQSVFDTILSSTR